MKRLVVITATLTSLLFFAVACQKWTDPEPVNDPRLTNPYCNDPDAVNFNRGFPGKPNDSVCTYPSDIYKGKYVYYDSVYLPNGVFSYVNTNVDTFLYMYPLSKTQVGVVGFCAGGDTIKFTVNKSYNSYTDSTAAYLKGQMFCTPADTVQGTMSPDLTDSTNSTLLVNLTVFSDTAINVHKTSARKQK